MIPDSDKFKNPCCGYVGNILTGSTHHTHGESKRFLVENYFKCPSCGYEWRSVSFGPLRIVSNEEQDGRFAVYDAEAIIYNHEGVK